MLTWYNIVTVRSITKCLEALLIYLYAHNHDCSASITEGYRCESALLLPSPGIAMD
jgi:hypothetical protein